MNIVAQNVARQSRERRSMAIRPSLGTAGNAVRSMTQRTSVSELAMFDRVKLTFGFVAWKEESSNETPPHDTGVVDDANVLRVPAGAEGEIVQMYGSWDDKPRRLHTVGVRLDLDPNRVFNIGIDGVEKIESA